MNLRFLFLPVFLFLLSTPAGADEIKADSKITDVTVFQDRALVTRKAALELPKGEHRVLFTALPGGLESDSLTARGQGQAKVKLFGASLEAVQLEDSQSPKTREIEAQIEAVQDKIRGIENAKQVIEQKKKFLSSIQASTLEQIGKDIVTKMPAAREVADLAAYIEQEMAAAFDKEVSLDVDLREASKELDRLNRELYEIQGGGGKQEWTIAVDLEAEEAGTFELEVSYRLLGATWQPVYEARAFTDKVDVQMIAHAMVRQSTGEDWNNVALELSTANPSAGGRMPEIQPWFLRKYEPPPPAPLYDERQNYGAVAMKRSRASLEMLAKDDASVMPAAAAPVLAEVAQATVVAKGPSVSFKLSKPESIPSNWQPKKVSVASQSLPASFEYEVTPRLSPHAYWRAKVKNNSEALLLPGAVQVFVDGAFVGSSAIKLIGPSETFDLFLGMDERIRVEYKQLKAKEDVSVLPGLHGRVKTVDYQYLTTIRNFKKEEASIVLWDQVPVSQHDEIKVEQTSFDPPPSEDVSEKPGVRKWLLKVGAGAKQDLKSAYRLKYPVEFTVEGLA